MTRRFLVPATAIAALSILFGSTPAISVEGSGSLDPYRMYAHLMVDGGPGEAGEVASTPCRAIHIAIDDYNTAAPWDNPPEGYEDLTFYKLFHEDLGQNSTTLLNTWLESEGRDNYHHTETFRCTFAHDNGWLAASETIVEVSENDHNLLIITSEGDTTCTVGDLLLASATYRFVWNSFTKDWQYYYGTDWIENPSPGVLVSGNIDFECASIFDPDTGFSEVLEAVPTSQTNLNPNVRGLTGLDTWLWYDFSSPSSYEIGPITANVDALGFSWELESHAWVDQVLWDVDCTSNCTTREYAADFDTSGYEYAIDFEDGALSPAAVYEAGIEADDQAAFEHVYAKIGDYNISTATTWRGYWFITDTYGGPGPPHIHPTIIVAEGWDLPVISVRSELRIRP